MYLLSTCIVVMCTLACTVATDHCGVDGCRMVIPVKNPRNLGLGYYESSLVTSQLPSISADTKIAVLVQADGYGRFSCMHWRVLCFSNCVCKRAHSGNARGQQVHYVVKIYPYFPLSLPPLPPPHTGLLYSAVQL